MHGTRHVASRVVQLGGDGQGRRDVERRAAATRLRAPSAGTAGA